MKSANVLKATGLVLFAVVLGMLTVQGSYALWNKAVSFNAGTVQAADFRINLTDSDTSRVTDMTLADGTAASLALSTTPTGVVLPGESTYAGVQVGNVTNASGAFTIRVNTTAPIIDNNAGSPLTSHLVVKSVAATSLSQCDQPALYAAATPSGTAETTIAKDGAGVFCFQISLSVTMPASLSGQTAQIAIPITVNQL